MARITRDDVLKLAKLSRLSLTDEEVDAFTRELGSILEYVEQLNAVDTAGLDPTYQVTGLTNIQRDDEIVDYGVSIEDLLKNAPSIEEGQFKVKRMIG